jgi:transposase
MLSSSAVSVATQTPISETKKILLVEDNAGWHRSKNVENIEGLTVEFLPPYSPELQPIPLLD